MDMVEPREVICALLGLVHLPALAMGAFILTPSLTFKKVKGMANVDFDQPKIEQA
jgi:hypothetical protein